MPSLPLRLPGITLALLTGAALCLPALADDPLEGMVQQALRANPGLLAQRAKVAASAQRPTQVQSLPDPEAELEFMNLAADGSSGTEALTRGVSLGVSQTLPSPGKRRLAREAAERDTDVEVARLHTMERQVRAEVLEAAYQYRLDLDLLRLSDQTAEVLRTVVSGALARYETGQGSQAEVLSAQSEVTRVAVQRRELETQRAIARARLENLLAAPADEGALEQLALPPPSALPPLDSLLAAVAGESPEVATALAGVAGAEARAALARKGSAPDFTVGARYRFRDMTMGGKDYLTATVGMTLPFFHSRDRYRPALEEALDLRESAKAEADQARNEARYRFAEAYQEAQAEAEVFALYDQGLLPQARQAYEAARSGYAAGRTDFASLRLSLANLYLYESDAVRARAGYLQRVAEMESVLGRPLPASSPGSAVPSAAPAPPAQGAGAESSGAPRS